MGSEAGTKGAGMAQRVKETPDDEKLHSTVNALVEEDCWEEADWVKKIYWELAQYREKERIEEERRIGDRSPLTDELIAQYEHDEGRS